MKWAAITKFLKNTDIFFTAPLIFSAITFVILHLLFFGLVRLLPHRIPLFYSLPWGETQLAYRAQFLILPAVVLLVSAFNSALAWRLREDQVLLRRMLFMIVLTVDIIILIAGVKIIWIFL